MGEKIVEMEFHFQKQSANDRMRKRGNKGLGGVYLCIPGNASEGRLKVLDTAFKIPAQMKWNGTKGATESR